MTYTICSIPGDGIGHEVVPAGLEILKATGLDFITVEAEAGFACYEKNGTPIPDATLEAIRTADATLFGAVTTPPNIDGYKSAIITMRKTFDLFVNLRPTLSVPIPSSRPNIDLTIVRENTEGEYVGDEDFDDERAVTRRIITRKGSERIVRYAFEFATLHKKNKVTIVHKANVMRATDGLFLKTAQTVAAEFPSIEAEYMIVDAMAMRLIKDPENFQVMVTTNMFGDILSDEACMLVGGLGLAASGNMNTEIGIFEPVHGSAPDIAGQGIANPLATILAAAMMLDFLKETEKAALIRNAVHILLKEGHTLPKDLGGTATTSEVTQALLHYIQ